MKGCFTFLLACSLLLSCTACGSPQGEDVMSQTTKPTPSTTPEPVSEAPLDLITQGYWETNSFRLSDGLIYQFKDDGTYNYWFTNGGYGATGNYIYQDGKLLLMGEDGTVQDEFHYHADIGQFVSVMTQHIIEQEYIGDDGVVVSAQFEETKLLYHESPTAPDPGPAPTATPVPSAIDLSDPNTYRQVNMFLSNFSECSMGSFSIDDPDYALLVGQFAFGHAAINGASLEDCYVMIDGYPATRRLSEKNILKTLRRFFGDSIDLTAVASVCDNGYYYGTLTDDAYGYAFAIADSVTDLGNDRFEVQFHVYGVPGAECETYNAHSTSDIYSTYPGSLPEPLHHTAPKFSSAPGTATLVLASDQTSAVPYHLLTWSCSYEWDGYYNGETA